MVQLRFGNFFEILYLARATGINQEMLGEVVLTNNRQIEYNGYDKGIPSKLKSGKQDINEVILKKLEALSVDDLKKGLKQIVQDYLNPRKLKNVVGTLIKIIELDSAVSVQTNIGADEGYLKSDIIESDHFDAVDFLGNVFYFVLRLPNHVEVDDTSNFIKDYFSNDSNFDNIFLDAKVRAVIDNRFSKTVLDNTFDATFDLVIKLSNKGVSHLSDCYLYRLSYENSKFTYSELKDILELNLGGYVFSRSRIKKFYEDKSEALIGKKATKLLKDQLKDNVDLQEQLIGELLIYIFLEHVLNAPKLLSCFDFNGNKWIKNRVLHFQTVQNNSQLFNQIIIGTSLIEGSLKNALDDIFQEINNIKNNFSFKNEIVDNSIIDKTFDNSTSKYLLSMITPSKIKYQKKPEQAFGVFIGYTVDTSLMPPNCSYEEFANEQMLLDILAAESYIKRQIELFNLEGYNLYFYFLPLNDADGDKYNIMKELLDLGDWDDL